MKNPKLHKEKLLKSLEKNLGIVSAACKDVGISRNQFYIYYNEDSDFRRGVDDINEITLDFAENQLLKKIKEGSERSILFYMRYKGRKRGYTEHGSLDLNIKSFDINSLIKFDDGDDGTDSPE
jgi:hypothetical protein